MNIVYLGLNNFHFMFCLVISRLQILKVFKNEVNSFCGCFTHISSCLLVILTSASKYKML